MNARRLSVAALSIASREAFVSALGDIFEHSPWVAERAWTRRPFEGLDDLHDAMVDAVHAAPPESQLALIRSHPELAGREATTGALTEDSGREQSSAGLDRCSPAELARLRELNRAYRERFGFPFVMAVRGRNREEILNAMEARLADDPDTALERSLVEIFRIARLRLEERVVS